MIYRKEFFVVKKLKLAFFLISHKAHIHHVIPIACAASMVEDFDVDILTSTEENKDIIQSLLKYYPNHRCNLIFLKPTKFYSFTRQFKFKLYPTYSSVIKKNYEKIVTYDVLLTPQWHLNRIMNRNETNNIKFILLTHGSGDSPVSYSTKMKDYDLNLLGSEEIVRLAAEHGLGQKSILKSIGYAKLEMVSKIKTAKVFENGRPTIFFNPSYVKDFSSWYDWGTYILDYFSQNNKFNLIFAPHIKLFQNKSQYAKSLKRKYSFAKNIIIDVGSDALIDMTYTKFADIYIGDISSQGYEFLYKPRPCVFLNPYGNKDVKMWELGDVVCDIRDLESAINDAFVNHSKYKKKQEEEFAKRFSITDVPPGERAAQAIKEFLNV